MLDSLSVYAIRRNIGGQDVTTFDDALDPDKLQAVTDTAEFETPAGVTPAFKAKLYLWAGTPKPPAWLNFVEGGFGRQFAIPDTTQSKGLLVVEVIFRVTRFYAIPFGMGRFQLKRHSIENRYGLRVALNALYEGDGDADVLNPANRIRQVESKTVGANTMRTTRQANRRTDFEQFEFDTSIDQLGGVTGRPLNLELARRIRGTDSIRLGRPTDFNELGALCRNIARYHERRDYKPRFQFLDNFTAITDPVLLENLTETACENLTDSPQEWQFSPPGIQNFDQVATYRIKVSDVAPVDLIDPEVSDIVGLFPDDVDHVETVRATTVASFDENDNQIEQWPLIKGVDGQIEQDGETYLLEEGDFYEIAEGYLEQLDAAIDQIPESAVQLPASVRVVEDGKLKEISEGDYNELAAAAANHFLLDKKTVKISARTSAIEVCDVLTEERQLVHVKRKFGSSSLSHLFGQGYVSSELLLQSREYREKVREKIGDAEPAFRDLFNVDGEVSANWEVVYAIVGKWDGAKPVDKLPFFSKVNLRKHATALRNLGFTVTYARVEVVDP